MPSKARYIQSLMRSHSLLNQADEVHKNRERAQKWFDQNVCVHENIRRAMHGENSNARIASYYTHAHAILDYLYRGNLQNKRILHLGGATGAYAHFLQDFCKADSVALDLNKAAIEDAKSRGIKAIHANAIPQRVHGDPVPLAKRTGVWVPQEKRTQLQFKDNHFDIIFSDHFLFANYSREVKGDIPGFELHKSSMHESEQALAEYNRVLRTGGRLIVTAAEPKTVKGLAKFRRFYKTRGFVVEHIFDDVIELRDAQPLDPAYVKEFYHNEKRGPHFFVLRKIEPLSKK